MLKVIPDSVKITKMSSFKYIQPKNVHYGYIIERLVFISLFSISLLISLAENVSRIFVHKNRILIIDSIHSLNQIGVLLISASNTIIWIDLQGVFQLIYPLIVRIFTGIGFITIIYVYAGASRISYRSWNWNNPRKQFLYNVFIVVNLIILSIALLVSCLLFEIFNHKMYVKY